MSIIWCTAGVSGMHAPAMRANLGLQTPHAMTTTPVWTSPSVVLTREIRPPSVSMSSTSTSARTSSAPSSTAASRMSVPARSESTTPTVGE